jgi:hypothetical protein
MKQGRGTNAPNGSAVQQMHTCSTGKVLAVIPLSKIPSFQDTRKKKGAVPMGRYHLSRTDWGARSLVGQLDYELGQHLGSQIIHII